MKRQYVRAKEFGTIHRGHQHVERARAIVEEQFASRTAIGMLRLREHPLFHDGFQLAEFMDVLGEVFARG